MRNRCIAVKVSLNGISTIAKKDQKHARDGTRLQNLSNMHRGRPRPSRNVDPDEGPPATCCEGSSNLRLLGASRTVRPPATALPCTSTFARSAGMIQAQDAIVVTYCFISQARVRKFPPSLPGFACYQEGLALFLTSSSPCCERVRKALERKVSPLSHLLLTMMRARQTSVRAEKVDGGRQSRQRCTLPKA